MKHFSFLLFILLVYSVKAFTQSYQIKGNIIDLDTREPLAFVSISVNEGTKGYISNIDGNFEITSPIPITQLQFNLVGYESLKHVVKSDSTRFNLEIKLKKRKIQLNEVVVFPGTNPAHRIISKVLGNRDKNNPEKMLSFTYTSYNKFYFTIQEDTLQKNTTKTLVRDTLKPDSAQIKLENFINKQHLFLSEFVSERHFKHPDKNIENVLSSKISGLNDPVFVLLATQMQSFSFYTDYITILDKHYINPISQGCFNRYFFLLEDTLYHTPTDSIFVIYYRPLKGKKFDGLEGVLYINTNGYAIQNVISSPYSTNNLFSVKIQQQYQLIDNQQWFPTELNTNVVFKNTKLKSRSRELYFAGVGKCYIRDVKINPDVSNINFSNVELEIDPNANKKDDKYWSQHRPVPLSKKDSVTYHIIDSIGKKIKLDQKMKILEAIINGYIPIGCFNLEYNKIIGYNKYEGLKLGLGLSTNQKVFSFASIGGFFQYGFKDKNWKYGGNLQLFPKWYSNTKLTLKYSHYFTETGSLNFLDEYILNSTEIYRNYFISQMDKTTEYEMAFTNRSFNYLKYNIYINRSDKNFMNYGYIHTGSSDTLNSYSFTEIGFQLKFAYGEKFMKTPRGQLISLGTKYPIIWLNIRKGTDWLKGNASYTKFEAKISKNFITKSFGTTHLQVKTGTISGIIPVSNLYSSFGCYEPISFFVENNFGTIRPGEFYSKEFLSLFFRQNFGSLLFKSNFFKPEFNIVTNIGWGKLPEKWQHPNLNFRTMEKGYIESGILINRLLNAGFVSYGIGCYYRYGYYRFAKIADNFAYKLSFLYNL